MGTQQKVEAGGVAVLFEQDAPIKQILERAVVSIGQIVRGNIKAEQIVRGALLQISTTPALQSCDKLSIVQGVMHAASLGLMIGGPAGEAALVPYKNKAQLLPMVRGLVTLAMRSGFVLSVTPRAVYKGEKFKVLYGTEDRIIHEPNFDIDRTDTNITHVYAVFQMAGGGKPHFDVMNRNEVERIRSVSRGKDAGPWVEWWGEQAKKTVVKRGSKMVPLSPEFRAAVELDNRFETGHMNEPSELLDSDADVHQATADKTAERAANLRERVKGSKATATILCEECKQPTAKHDPDCSHFVDTAADE